MIRMGLRLLAMRISGLLANSAANPAVSLLAACFSLLGALHVPVEMAWAQEGEYTVTEYAYRRLERAQEALEKKAYREAMSALDEMKQRTSLSAYEKALMWQTYAYTYVAREDLRRAVESLEKAASLNALPPDRQTELYFNIGQIHLSREKPKLAIAAFEQWTKRVERASPDALYTVGLAYARAERFEVALKFLDPAIRGKPNAPMNWSELQLACLVQLERWAKAISVLQGLIERDLANPTRWKQLSALYQEAGRGSESVATLELMYWNDLLKTSDEVVLLARNLIASNVPSKAARILRDGMKRGVVGKNAETFELLGTAFLTAGNREEAVAPLSRSAEMSPSGRLDVEVGQVLLDLERYGEAAKRIRAGLKKGGLRQPGQAHLLLGIAEFRADRKDAAKRAFAAARDYDDARRSAASWLSFLKKGG